MAHEFMKIHECRREMVWQNYNMVSQIANPIKKKKACGQVWIGTNIYWAPKAPNHGHQRDTGIIIILILQRYRERK